MNYTPPHLPKSFIAALSAIAVHLAIAAGLAASTLLFANHIVETFTDPLWNLEIVGYFIGAIFGGWFFGLYYSSWRRYPEHCFFRTVTTIASVAGWLAFIGGLSFAAFYWAGWTAKSDFGLSTPAVWAVAIAAGFLVFLPLSVYAFFTLLGSLADRSELR